MQFEGYRRSSNVPNLTPLIDVVFLLLIFFMLTSHFVRHESLNIDLPEAETSERLQEGDVLEIVIDADGQLIYQQHTIDVEALEEKLRADLLIVQDKNIRIKGDQQADLGKAIRVLDIARKAGASGVDIVTERN
ncbi:MAG: biopolymer transporter ExbD [Gammaproteobacteria bacterium]|nr:biopolymer transporter ExbD [Gammaproteobacteria bacterium]